jgi:hypothetical protein
VSRPASSARALIEHRAASLPIDELHFDIPLGGTAVIIDGPDQV